MSNRLTLTQSQQDAIHEVLRLALVEIRFMASEQGERAADLADALHEVPRLLQGHRDHWNKELTVALLQGYQDKYAEAPQHTFDYAGKLAVVFHPPGGAR